MWKFISSVFRTDKVPDKVCSLPSRRQGKFYQVEVVSRDGQILPPKEIKKQLQKVVEMAGG